MQILKASFSKLSFNRIKSLKNIFTSKNYSTSASVSQDEDLMTTFTNPNLSYSTTLSKYSLVVDTINDQINKNSINNAQKMVYGFPHQGINLTFGELKERVDVAANNLLSLGFQKGDRIAFALPNTHEFLITFLAASQIGLISVALNPAYQFVEFEYMLKKTNVKAVFIYDSFKTLNHIEVMKKLCPNLESFEPGKIESKQLPSLKHIFVLNSPFSQTKKEYRGTWPFSIVSEAKSTTIAHQKPYVDIDDPCLILFTSGTTGKPKGALMTHSTLLNSAYLSTVVVGNPDGLRMLCNPIPMFHIFGLSTGILIPLLMGTSIVFPFFFPDTVASMKAIQKYKCNTIRGTPTQFVDLLNHKERSSYDLSSLENFILGGSTVPSELVVKLKTDLKAQSIIIGYGMTETSLCHSVVTVADEKKGFKYAYESVGRSIPYTESKIIDTKTGETLPHNVEGELCIRGRHVIKGYWDEPVKTTEAIDTNGWLHTGDIFTMDAEGYLYFKGRYKDLIIRGGANIYPAEVESYLCKHPSIADAQVFGVPDERLQEEVCAWIKLKADCKMNEAQVKEFCKSNISHFKIPKYIKFVENFPINANGKVLKGVMKEIAIKELNLN